MRLKLFGKLLLVLVVAGVFAIADLPASQKAFVKQVPVIGPAIANLKVSLGLDLSGGTHLDYKIVTKGVPERDIPAVVAGVHEVIERRVNALGVSEPIIYESQVADEHHIVVELAGIKDIEQAKALVGKTISLEFKEQKTTLDPGEADAIMTKASDFFTRVKLEPANFETIFSDYEQKPAIALDPGTEWEWLKDLPENFLPVATLTPGAVYPELIQPGATDYYLNAAGSPAQRQGAYVVKLIAREDNAPRETKHDEERSASHILIAFNGAERAAATVIRSEADAQKFADEILIKIKADPTSFATLAKENSDDASNKDKGGDLDFFKRGQMAPAFEDAVFDTKVSGLVPNVVRTAFGYHIIRLNEIKPAKTENTNEPRVKIAKAFFSTTPDGWTATGLTGQHFRRADVGSDPTTMRPLVNIYFTTTATAAKAGTNWWQLVWYLVAVFAGISAFSYGIGVVLSGGNRNTARFDKIITSISLLILAGAVYGITLTSTSLDSTPPPPAEKSEVTSETDKTGVDLFAALTKRNLQKPIAIFLDGFPIIDTNSDGVVDSRDPPYAPVVQAEITNGQAVISGLSNYEEANQLAQNLNTGAIPAPIKLTSQFTIGATLGADALAKSLFAGAIGILIVIAFMTLYYRLPGLLASLALLIYGVILVFVIQVFPGGGIVLTLAGIAGVVLSIGMAVDANILIFERMKEELRLGKSLSAAVEDGFNRAWTSIRDSNASSLITCAILFWFGSSIIQGFALTLALGIVVSLFTAITVTRLFLRLLVGSFLGRSGFLFGVSGASFGQHSHERSGVTKRF